MRKSKERTRRSGTGVELETTASENVGVMDHDADFRPDFEAIGDASSRISLGESYSSPHRRSRNKARPQSPELPVSANKLK